MEGAGYPEAVQLKVMFVCSLVKNCCEFTGKETSGASVNDVNQK